jgi:type II secretory pathway component PulM
MTSSTRAQTQAAAGGGLRAAMEAQLDAMTPRDRKLLAGLVVFFGLVLSTFVVISVRGTLSGEQQRLDAAEDTLQLVELMAAEHANASAKIAAAEERLKQYKGQPASAFLERVAGEAGLREQFTVTQQGSEDVDGLKQTSFRVELRKVQIRSATEFVHAVETSGYPITVDLARFRTATLSGTEGKVIDLTLELTAFTLDQE